MNTEIWKKVQLFNLDEQQGEYDFSIRLASENGWTKNFTAKAILEYKKFMFLAATSGSMVSPSEMVDIVWHQHLLFTNSYQQFCKILGTEIQHIPSTHNRSEAQKFREASDFTERVYRENFGEQPKDIWQQNSMYDSLNLSTSKIKFPFLVLLLIVVSAILFFPLFAVLKPVYVQFENPYFVFSYILCCISFLLILKKFNDYKIKEIIRKADEDSFIFNLEPYEMIYLKKRNISHIINGTLSELIDNKSISLSKKGEFSLESNVSVKSKEQSQVVNYLEEFGTSPYMRILKNIRQKPVFKITEFIGENLIQTFRNSIEFQKILVLNILISGILINLGIARIVLGALREKPVVQISIITLLIFLILIFFLWRLSVKPTSYIVPKLYTEEILPQKGADLDWQWSYFLVGSAVLTSSFIPFVNRPSYDGSSSSCGGSSSSDSSCGGSSCGGGCGGCGGGGD